MLIVLHTNLFILSTLALSKCLAVREKYATVGTSHVQCRAVCKHTRTHTLLSGAKIYIGLLNILYMPQNVIGC